VNGWRSSVLSLAVALLLLLPAGSAGQAPEGMLPSAVPLYLPLAFKSYAGCTTLSMLLSPADGSTPNTLIPLFRWNDGNDPNSTSVRLQVAKDRAFEVDQWMLQTSRRGEQEFRFENNLDAATTYYWRAYVMCGDTIGPYSETWSFTTGLGGTVLPAPALVAPPNGSTLPGETTTMEWAPVSGAAGYLQHYRKAGTLGYSYNWVTETHQPAGRLSPGTTYEWWIAAWNDYAIGAESERWQFTAPAAASSIPQQGLDRRYVMDEDGLTSVVVESEGR